MTEAVPCLVACGANQGDCELTLTKAYDRFARIPGVRELRRSRWCATDAVGGPVGQDRFLNGALAFGALLSPAELHQQLLLVEEQLGRTRTTRWGPRNIDLDLLLYGEECRTEESLLIPHPRMTFRRFVLEPAAEVAPAMIEPISGLTINALLQCIDQRPPLVILEPETPSEDQTQQQEVAPDWLQRLCTGLGSAQSDLLIPLIERGQVSTNVFLAKQWSTELKRTGQFSSLPTLVTTQSLFDAVCGVSAQPRLQVICPSALPSLAGQPVGVLSREAIRGPYLDLRKASPESAAIELLAAIDAMR